MIQYFPIPGDTDTRELEPQSFPDRETVREYAADPFMILLTDETPIGGSEPFTGRLTDAPDGDYNVTGTDEGGLEWIVTISKRGQLCHAR